MDTTYPPFHPFHPFHPVFRSIEFKKLEFEPDPLSCAIAIDEAVKRQEPVTDWYDEDDWDDNDWEDWEEPLPCWTSHCDGTCEICSDARGDSQEQMDYLRELELIRLGIKRKEPFPFPPPQPLNDDNFGPDDIPF